MSNGNLSVVKIKSAKVPVDKKQLKLFDGGGLYLLVTAKGGKYWRLDYRFNGKRKTLALGVYPDVSLSDARVYGMQSGRSLILKPHNGEYQRRK